MIHVILNHASGAARQSDTAKEIADLFSAAGSPAHLHRLNAPDRIAEAVQAALGGADVRAVVAAGGDGTVNAVASALAGRPTPLGVLPLGSLNHFAKDLQIPLDLAKAVDVIVAGRIYRIDVGQVNDRTFVNNSSIGVYPNIIERRERLRAQGHRKWPAFIKATLDVLGREDEVTVRLDIDGRSMTVRTPFVFVGNNEYQIAGIHVGGRARLDGGRLFAASAPRVHTRDLPRLVAHALMGRSTLPDGLDVFSAGELWIETLGARDVGVACDGELVTLRTPLRFRSWPGALRDLVPDASS